LLAGRRAFLSMAEDNVMANKEGKGVTIDQKSYKEYLAKKDTISNERIRPDNQTFLDAIMTIDMKTHPDGKRVIQILKAL